jgi:hypothetical protein
MEASAALADRKEISLEEHRPAHPRSLTIAERGINSSGDFRNFMSALMTDVIRGALSPEVTNAACNAGGKLLKMVELEFKFASNPGKRTRELPVAFEVSEVSDEAMAGEA